MVKADLLGYGAIGFQKFWLEKQKYTGQDYLLKEFSDHCFKIGLDILAVPSEDDKINPGYPEDRFGFLSGQIDVLNDSGEYLARMLGNNAIRVENVEGRRYFILNGQVVHVKENGRDNPIKHLVIGSNSVPQGMPLMEIAQYCQEKRFPQFLMDVADEAKYDPNLKIFRKVAGLCDGVVVHSATHSINPTFGKIGGLISRLPKIGKLGEFAERYSRETNSFAEGFAKEIGMQGIAVSRAHNIDSIGAASIEFANGFNNALQNGGDDKVLLKTIKSFIRNGSFEVNPGYDSALKTFDYALNLARFGGAPDRFKNERSSYNT